MDRNLVTILWIYIIWTLIASVLNINLLHTQAPPEHNKFFPVPDNLKPNVEFWIKVYTLYSSDQIIIHDSEDLRIIYEVVDVNKLVGHNRISNKIIWREVEKIKDRYREILNKLSTYEQIDPELLDKQERRIYYLFKSKSSLQAFKQATQNIRGQQGLRDEFRRGLMRSGRYIEHIEKIFRKYNIPQELIALAHVESLFNHRAYSKFGAAGIWQFTRSTGRRFLKINYTVDERFDPIKSTEAAAKLLKENYTELSSWPLAITAYNHGLNGLKRAVRQLGTSDIGVIADKYKSRNFKFASRNFYAEFLAALEASKNYKIYFGELKFERPEKFLAFNVPNYVKLAILTERLSITTDDIKRLNPSLRNSVLSSKRHLPKGFELRIPWKKHFDPAVVYADIPTTDLYQQQVSTEWYQVERGDNLQKIARRFNTTIADLMELNDIRNPHQIYVGQVLRLRPEETLLAEGAKSVNPTSKETKKTTQQEKKIVTTDQLSGSPAQSKISSSIIGAQKTAERNEKVTGEPDLTPQQSVAKVAEKATAKILKPSFGTINVQPEETLGHFADWLAIPTQVLRNLNGLRYGQDIHLGQEIKLVFDRVSEKEFRRKRMEYHRGIEEDFFTSFVVEGVMVHKVKSGENIWYLCSQVYEVPYWLVRKYNPNKNLERLNTGDELIIPMVAPIDNNRNIG
ncbi:MAG: transglycosylase SLT domain-containing protein [bacterium]|nr:MAG: transglycosylase SLT domain-containing protein [bacterium]